MPNTGGATFTRDIALDKEAVTAHKQFCADTEYLFGKEEEMRTKYPDCFVAVHHGEVVAAQPTLDELTREVSRRGVLLSAVAITYVSKEPRHLML